VATAWHQTEKVALCITNSALRAKVCSHGNKSESRLYFEDAPSYVHEVAPCQADSVQEQQLSYVSLYVGLVSTSSALEQAFSKSEALGMRT
jgi:hypothetical protein